MRYLELVRVFKNSWFTRFARKEGIADDELRAMVNQLEAGQWDADLGGGVYKQRLARPGKGKSGGYRIILFFKSGDRTFFVYGFAKPVRANIDDKELRRLKTLARINLGLPDRLLDEQIASGQWLELP
ncbi:MAG: type II toxin-antitoxin system RelE/ParE family toxin [Treponema sp.]|nr:type II toxin-antitoxin system RelE/ParE family toxin [Treponema sp.]